MAPNNFDKHIKQALEKRSIQPSNEAWNKLSNRLEFTSNNSTKKGYVWFGLAASVAAILLVAFQFIKTDNINNSTIKVVDTSKEENLKTTTNNKQNKGITNKFETNTAITKAAPVVKNNTPIANKIKKTEVPSTVVVASTQQPQLLPKEAETITRPTKKLQEELTFEDQKVQQIVAKVKQLKTEKQQVTDAEIEALLQQAQQEIAFKKIYNESTGIVDANALLRDVEDDIERSFRTKVFDALKASYSTVKTAVANRNN
ncbi:hypothetical protein FUA26_14355 [Seonamhaeicola algicola]|uniref:Uncharacterized protein n=1 Tax=Seonamhaeicola algicola TaxID=1719036 RepID=A0A5C7AC70_9FLAO|nr:hypothetical protein [Seonamhaeicola algicola]TXE06158.1 hypothetical protein FUA26_14355 [Seonamhaeicola algicola]